MSRLLMVICFIWSTLVLLKNITIMKDLLHSAPKGMPNLEKDGGNHDSKDADKSLERKGQ